MRRLCVSVCGLVLAFLLLGSGHAKAHGGGAPGAVNIDLLIDESSAPHPGHPTPGDRTSTCARRRQDLGPSIDVVAECFSFGVLMLSSDSGLLFANRLAKNALAARDGLEEHEGRIRLQRAGLQRHLLGCLTELSSPDAIAADSRILGVPNRGGRTRFVLKLVSDGNGPGSPIIGTLTDLENEHGIDQRSLVNVFGLSQREGEFAAFFAAGLGLDDISAEMKISSGTARVHLRNILMKIGCASKSELARKLARANY